MTVTHPASVCSNLLLVLAKLVFKRVLTAPQSEVLRMVDAPLPPEI
jgi:hypothetical protein